MTDLVPLAQLHHHPDNPPGRHTDVDELADSIRAVGVLQPLLIEPDGDGYVVVAGNRRLAAAHLAGLTAAPCVIRPTHDRDSHTEVRLIENGHRKNLTPMQQARAFGQRRNAGLTQTEIAKRTGFSLSHVSNRLALLELDDATQARVDAGVIHPDAALAAVRAARGNQSAPKRPGGGHLGFSHPLAKAAQARCRTQHSVRGGQLIGATACGKCWESVIRADERWVVEEGEGDVDNSPVLDEIAIERAASCRGDLPPLTRAERIEAVNLMQRRGITLTAIGERLSISGERIRQIVGTTLVDAS